MEVKREKVKGKEMSEKEEKRKIKNTHTVTSIIHEWQWGQVLEQDFRAQRKGRSCITSLIHTEYYRYCN